MSAPFWLIEIRYYNFRSFQTGCIKFPRTGLTAIRGKNLDTGGSSYSGKSTIGLGISYPLGYMPYSAKDQRSWGSEGQSAVELDIGTEAGICTIRAGDRPWIKLPGKDKITSAAAIKEARDQFLGVTPEVLSALTWQRQKKGSRFLGKGDAEKKEFLANVMPWLTKIEREADACDDRIKALEAELAGHKSVLAQLDHTLAGEIISEPVLAAEPVLPIADDSEQYEARLAEARARLDRERVVEDLPGDGGAEILRAKQEAEQRLSRLRGQESERIRQFQRRGDELGREYGDAKRLADQISALAGENSMLLNKSCPTCLQPWIDASGRQAKVAEQLTAAHAAYARLPELHKAYEQHIFTPDPMIKALEGALGNINAEWGLFQDRKSKLSAAASKAREVILSEMRAIEQEHSDHRRALADHKHRVEMVQKENAHRTADFNAALNRRQVYLNRRNDTCCYIHATQTKLDAELDFQTLIGRTGFLGSIFDEVLAEITEETNKILASVANTAHVTVNFRSEAVTQKGKVNKTITPVVTIGGNVADLESGASGGMETSIGLAVDLAVATVVSRRTNTWPGWLILDESFEGLDQTSKETMLEMLKQHACNRLVLVVDHASEMKEMFSAFIDVEFSKGVSRVL